MKAQLTLNSGNSKTGNIPVSMTERKSCPNSCPIKASCYAKSGYIRLHWDRLENKDVTWNDFIKSVEQLPNNQLWRHNSAGDLPGVNESIHSGRLRQLVKANTGKRGFTYTHKKPNTKNANLIKEANANGFTINLSANSLQQADEYIKLEIGPVVVVLPKDSPNKLKTPEGNSVIVCPAQIREDITCSNCGLCQISNRKAIIGFKAHGIGKNKLSEMILNNENKND